MPHCWQLLVSCPNILNLSCPAFGEVGVVIVEYYLEDNLLGATARHGSSTDGIARKKEEGAYLSRADSAFNLSQSLDQHAFMQYCRLRWSFTEDLYGSHQVSCRTIPSTIDGQVYRPFPQTIQPLLHGTLRFVYTDKACRDKRSCTYRR